jgi:probable phosphomutase (TIGR03848 family)
MPILLLVRHALTEATGTRLSGWTPGVHLSERGREQARGLVERLAPVRIAALYASPLERCRETAEPLAAARRLEVRDTEDIGEVRYGDWTGRTLAQLSKTRLWRSVQATPSTVRFPGGETLLEVQQRAVRQAAAIATAHPRGVIALVSHGDVIRLLLAHFAGLHVDLFQRLVVSPASVSVVAAGDGVPRILRINDTGGLGDLAPPRKRPRRKVGG